MVFRRFFVAFLGSGLLVLASCSGGADPGTSSGGTSTSGGTDTSSSSGSTSGGLPPNAVCSFETDAGRTSNALTCAPNPNVSGCSACRTLPDRDGGAEVRYCVFACVFGHDEDCPSGQTCRPAPNDSGIFTPACTRQRMTAYCQ